MPCEAAGHGVERTMTSLTTRSRIDTGDALSFLPIPLFSFNRTFLFLLHSFVLVSRSAWLGL